MYTPMAERRQYTGTQRLQIAWSGGIFVGIGLAVGVGVTVGLPVSLLVVTLVLTVAWFVGLGALGLRERRRWRRMVEASSFEPQIGPHTADLENIVDGRSVTVSTAVPRLLSQTHTEFQTSVNGVEASFTVQFERVTATPATDGASTGTDALDDAFTVEGASQNVDKILSAEVRSALLSIETPGICTVSGEAVTYEVPFTSLRSDELETIAAGIVVIAQRVEQVGRTG